MQIIRNICFLNTTLGVSFNKQLPEKVKRGFSRIEWQTNENISLQYKKSLYAQYFLSNRSRSILQALSETHRRTLCFYFHDCWCFFLRWTWKSMIGNACSFVHHGILHYWRRLFFCSSWNSPWLFLCSSWNSPWLATLVPWFIMEFSMIGDACSFVHHGILHDWRHLFFCSSWNSMIGDAWFSLRHVIPWLKTFFLLAPPWKITQKVCSFHTSSS